jgi:hypothetical protein
MARQPAPNDPAATQTHVATGKTLTAQELPRAKPISAAAAPAKGEPVGLRAELDELKEQGAFMLMLRAWLKASPAWLTSMVVHIVALLIMALILIPNPATPLFDELVAHTIDDDSDELEELPVEKVEELELTETTPSDFAQAVPTETVQEPVEAMTNLDTSAAAVQVELSELSEVKAIKSDLLTKIGTLSGSDLSGRGNPAARAQLLAQGGGNKASEDAVALALAWLASQQMPDGGWSFDFGASGGTLKTGRNGATGLALLPFLGAGQTHREGKYKRTVQGGLYYLSMNMKKDGSLIDGGNMYSHGIASIALAEGYAMTQDKGLHAPAQMACNFIMSAQDKVGGGWRYSPGQAGDTSVVGWQLMALKSGHMGYLAINPQTVAGATNFLNTVQSNSGGNYGYTGPGQGQATTAVGLLCRMYLGWKKDHPGIEKGIEFLDKTGPSKGNMYYNYYATQVMHHYEGEQWKKWNGVMRDFLVNTQEKANGPLQGSWLLKGDHGSERGGRLYCTAMACMTLEVYYRHLPLYKKQSTDNEFEGI